MHIIESPDHPNLRLLHTGDEMNRHEMRDWLARPSTHTVLHPTSPIIGFGRSEHCHRDPAQDAPRIKWLIIAVGDLGVARGR
jgi:hypothetical protein